MLVVEDDPGIATQLVRDQSRILSGTIPLGAREALVLLQQQCLAVRRVGHHLRRSRVVAKGGSECVELAQGILRAGKAHDGDQLLGAVSVDPALIYVGDEAETSEVALFLAPGALDVERLDEWITAQQAVGVLRPWRRTRGNRERPEQGAAPAVGLAKALPLADAVGAWLVGAAALDEAGTAGTPSEDGSECHDRDISRKTTYYSQLPSRRTIFH